MSERAPTLKHKAFDVMVHGSNSPEMPPHLKVLSLPELKLETDSRILLLSQLATLHIDEDGTQGRFVNYLRTTQEPDSTILENYRQNAGRYLGALVHLRLKHLSRRPHLKLFLKETNQYRKAYYQRSPEAKGVEAIYRSTKELIWAGINTSVEQFPHLIFSLDLTARRYGITADEAKRMTGAASHLPLFLAKLELRDLERYTELLNAHPYVRASMIKLTTRAGIHTPYFDQRIFSKMRQIDSKPVPRYPHRQHEGCPASVALGGQNSVIERLWRLSVNSIAELGYWQDEPSHFSDV